MSPKKYTIAFKWQECRNGKYGCHEYWETYSFVVMVFAVFLLRFRHGVIDVNYRR